MDEEKGSTCVALFWVIIMFLTIKKDIKLIISDAINSFPDLEESIDVQIDEPTDKKFGDFSTNSAMRLTKILRQNPLDIAQQLKEHIERQLPASSLEGLIDRIDVVKPGFLNFYLSPQAFGMVLEEVLTCKHDYGRSDFGAGQKYMIEFVSANPTGPLTVAHARQAAVGDVLVNILNFSGFDAQREYYVNDGGNQINILGLSLRLRAQELLGKAIDFPDDCYQGEYVKEIARDFLAKYKCDQVDHIDELEKEAKDFGKNYLLDVIKKDLEDFGVQFDAWTFESTVATPEAIQSTLQALTEKGLIYEHEGARWFKSTQFGDDKDRVVQKSDGAYTYLTPDIVYHKNKYDRGFDRLVDILGPDHHGYIGRIKAAAQALGRDVNALEVLIIQLASIYRDGQPLSMSTRKGEFISLREVIDEVGVDAARYFFLQRQVSQHLEFDLELAKKQNNDNPVYYIQYAHARICSVIQKAQHEAEVLLKEREFSSLAHEAEVDLIRKIGQFAKVLINCSKQLEPYGLVRYLQELAMAFHRFYDQCRVITDDKTLSQERLALTKATQIVLANGLSLAGVSAPEKM